MGANQNQPSDSNVKIMNYIAPSFVNAKDCTKHERVSQKIDFGKNEK